MTARWTDHEWYCFAHQSGYCSCRSGHLNTDEIAERRRLVAENQPPAVHGEKEG